MNSGPSWNDVESHFKNKSVLRGPVIVLSQLGWFTECGTMLELFGLLALHWLICLVS